MLGMFSKVAVGPHLGDALIMQGLLAPSAVKSRNSIVGLDGLFALGTFPVTVSFHPVVGHCRLGLFGLYVGCYTGGWGPLDTPFVHCVFAEGATKTFLPYKKEVFGTRYFLDLEEKGVLPKPTNMDRHKLQ